jgi:hypothetical protein
MPAANLNSPRSAIIDTRSPSSSPSDKMTSTGGVEVDKAVSSGTEKPGPSAEVDGGAGPEQKKNDAAESGNTANERKDGSRGGDGSPTQSNSYPQGYPSHLTPQQGYYMAYQSQVTPEPPSPAGYGPGVYDVGSFFQQPAGFQNSLYPGGAHQQGQHPPGSPSQSNSVSGIPPASPLFPRTTSQATAGLLDQHRMLDHSHGAPPSPAPSYLASPQLGPSAAGAAAMYQNMYAVHGSANSNSPDEYPGWTDSRYVVVTTGGCFLVSCFFPVTHFRRNYPLFSEATKTPITICRKLVPKEFLFHMYQECPVQPMQRIDRIHHSKRLCSLHR